MGLINMAKRIKEVHPYHVIMYKSGAFYKSFGKDAYILSSIFCYQMKTLEQNIPSVGFPLKSIMKVRSKLEEMKINYMIIDPRNNYDVDEIEDFNNLNNYEETFNKSYTRVKHRKIIQHISEELELINDKEEFKEIIRKIEDIIDENRKIQNY